MNHRTYLLFPLFIFSSCLLPVQAQDTLQVGPETILKTGTPGQNLRFSPAVAFGDNKYLVVWQEGWSGLGGDSRIYSMRTDKDGTILDSAGFMLAPCSTGVQEKPRVAFHNGLFLVVWHDFRNGKDLDILAARVSSEGEVLDNPPLAVAVNNRTQALPDITSDEKGFIVVWQGFQGNETDCRIFSRRIYPDGNLGTQFTLPYGHNPRIAWNGSVARVIYGDANSGTLQSLLLDSLGAASGASQFVMSKQPMASICGLPNNHWWSVVGYRALPDRWGWAGPGAMRCFNILVNGFASPTETTDPSSQLANWLDYSPSRYTSEGSPWPYGPSAVAWSGKVCVAAWIRFHIGASPPQFKNGDIYAARINGTISMETNPIRISAEKGVHEVNPALASDGTGRLFCVYESKLSDGSCRIAGRLLSTSSEDIIRNENLIEETNRFISIYPNPFNPVVTIQLPDHLRNAVVRVLDIQGHIVAYLSPNKNRTTSHFEDLKRTWNASGLPSGVYFISLKNNDIQINRRILLIH